MNWESKPAKSSIKTSKFEHARLHTDLLESLSLQSVLRQTDAGLLQLMSITEKLPDITTGIQAVEGQGKDEAYWKKLSWIVWFQLLVVWFHGIAFSFAWGTKGALEVESRNSSTPKRPCWDTWTFPGPVTLGSLKRASWLILRSAQSWPATVELLKDFSSWPFEVLKSFHELPCPALTPASFSLFI